MYSPEVFKITDEKRIEDFLQKYPFATLVTEEEGRIEVTHLPINRLSDGKFYGHLAKANVHANIDPDKEICLIFQGPHAYISPRFYASAFQVPTWNYSAVHLYGKITYIDDTHKAWDLITEITAHYEEEAGWMLPGESRYQELMEYFRVFEVNVTEIQAKFKINQNKSQDDRKSVIKSLKEKAQVSMAEFMEDIYNKDR
ncbi:MAG: FMN-binding negative transcriptional regulator [Epsilonproteobacteria bacterium]|nr:FMN-binding negative transcriptional regulator [Campylobacterota bacterium]